jgi:hypothetical protein
MLGSYVRESKPLESSSNIITLTNHLKYDSPYSFSSNFLSLFIRVIKIFVNVSIDMIAINADTDI